MPLGTTHRDAERDGAIGPAPVDARSFFVVLLVGVLCSSAAFVWTLSRVPAETRPAAASLAESDPTPGWGQRYARPAFTSGRYEELAASAHARRRDWGRDPEAWLFGAFAHEAMADEPGLRAMKHRATAERLWAELLAITTGGDVDGDGDADLRLPIRNEAYLQGWALTGLGRPVMARERFGSFLDQTRSRGKERIGAYNLACYSALAGEHADAVRLWRVSLQTGQIGDPRWGSVDPDFDEVRRELWHSDLAYRAWRLLVDEERAGAVRSRRGPRWFQNGTEIPLPQSLRGGSY